MLRPTTDPPGVPALTSELAEDPAAGRPGAASVSHEPPTRLLSGPRSLPPARARPYTRSLPAVTGSSPGSTQVGRRNIAMVSRHGSDAKLDELDAKVDDDDDDEEEGTPRLERRRSFA